MNFKFRIPGTQPRSIHSPTIVKLEQSMIPVIEAMSSRGLNIDVSKLSDLVRTTCEQKDAIKAQLKQALAIEHDVNFNSARDVAELLSYKFGLTLNRTKSGRYCSNRRTLKDINNPVTDDISRYRDLEKLHSSLKAIHTATDKERGKIFCQYIDSCPSGRLYAKSYNVQSFPEVARSVVYAESGCCFVLADYESFELRILSAVSHDTYFKKCWSEGLDLHRKVVSDMKNIPYDSVSEKERKLGKILNFGLAYGQEAAGLARNLHSSMEQAQKLIDAYKSNIPEIEIFKLEAVKKARSSGFSETYFGRKRFLPDISSPIMSNRKKAERQVINHIIQGTGADIVKMSLVRLHKEGFRIDTMLHDGILLSVPEDKLHKSIERIKEIMETQIEGMRFPIACKTGKLWSECK